MIGNSIVVIAGSLSKLPHYTNPILNLDPNLTFPLFRTLFLTPMPNPKPIPIHSTIPNLKP